MQHITTARGLRLDKIGLGTWPMLGDECRDAVLGALDVGYRHIDTAAAYKNEDGIGAALSQNTVPRADLHVTTKIWYDQLTPEAMRASAARSLELLRTDYVDLLYIHWPSDTADLAAALETLVRLQQDGVTRYIGVANFPLPLLRWAVEEVRAPIDALQIEYHLLLEQALLLEYTRRHGIGFAAYSPLARNKVSEYAEVQAIAKKHGVSTGQVALNYLTRQEGVVAIPKSASRANQAANLAAVDLQLDAEDVAALDALPKDQRLVNPAWAPKWA